MKVIIDTIIFSLQHHGGVSVVWYELIKRLKNNPEIDVCYLKYRRMSKLGRLLDDDENNYINDKTDLFPLLCQRYLPAKLDLNDNSIFHSSYYRFAKGKNIRNVTTVHDFTYEYFFTGYKKHIHHHQKSLAIMNSDKIICVSNNTKYDLLRFYPNIKESNLKVVYNGVSADFQMLSKGNLHLPQGFPYSIGEYLLYVGDRRSAYKNFNMAVEASKLSKLPLVIVGAPLAQNEADYLNYNLKKQNYCVYCNISTVELNQLYNQAFALIYPSSYEGFGIPVIEAQKAGCPVVCSNTSSLPEVAGNAAFLIDKISSAEISDILISIKNGTLSTTQIVSSGLLNAERFNWDKSIEKLTEVYKEIDSNFN